MVKTKTANLYVRIEPNVKTEAETILTALGISASSAISMFYNQIIIQNGLPFPVSLNKAHPLDMSTMTKQDFDTKMETAFDDVKNGRVQSVKDTFSDLRKEFGLCKNTK